MANNKRRNRTKPVYNRGLLRSMLKHKLGSNKIKTTWHQLRG